MVASGSFVENGEIGMEQVSLCECVCVCVQNFGENKDETRKGRRDLSTNKEENNSHIGEYTKAHKQGVCACSIFCLFPSLLCSFPLHSERANTPRAKVAAEGRGLCTAVIIMHNFAFFCLVLFFLLLFLEKKRKGERKTTAIAARLCFQRWPSCLDFYPKRI